MASRAVKLLGCITLSIGTIGGLLGWQEKGLMEQESRIDLEEQLEDKENFQIYETQRQQLLEYICESTDKKYLKPNQVKIEGVLCLENKLRYLISMEEQQTLEDGDCFKKRVYYTVAYPKEKDEVLAQQNEEILTFVPFESLNRKQIVQIPYETAMTKQEQQGIEDLLEVIFSKDQLFLEKYENNWAAGFEAWEKFLKQAPLLNDQLSYSKETYNTYYSQMLREYSLSEDQVIADLSRLTYEVQANTTKKRHFFLVKIPVEVLRENDNRLYYNYDYLVGTNGNNVISLKYLGRELQKE